MILGAFDGIIKIIKRRGETRILDTKEFFDNFASDCAAGSANQRLTGFSEEKTYIGKTAFKLTNGGKNYSLLFLGEIDSTYGAGEIYLAGSVGDIWTIKKIRVGKTSARYEEPLTWKDVYFGGKTEKTVKSGEEFCSDAFELDAKADDYLQYEITFSGTRFPYHEEIQLDCLLKEEGGEFTAGKAFPIPLMIASDRRIKEKIGFLGDSITQGIGAPAEAYAHWVSLIAKALGSEKSVYNLGIGFARAYDAATDKGWLARAKRCDEVNVCLGVNDIINGRSAYQLKADLTYIVRALKNAGCRVVIFTVPPFDFYASKLTVWREVNEYIRFTLKNEADGFFDFAKVLGKEFPEEHIAKFGGHPNEEGSRAIAAEYLKSFGNKRM